VVNVVAVHPQKPEIPAYGASWQGLPGREVNRLRTRDVEVVDGLTPQDGEPVVHNWPFDIFRRTHVEQWLSDRGVETVVLVGVATGMAINIVAYQLADRLFSLIVPADCVTDSTANSTTPS
jgi:nicotinamidase-related amidase